MFYEYIEGDYGWRYFEDEIHVHWGRYSLEKNSSICNMHGWVPLAIDRNKVSVGQLYGYTRWLYENIDNEWEGPIGYMNFWVYRFTAEMDHMAFKLYVD